jgi:hypothetical protein
MKSFRGAAIVAGAAVMVAVGCGDDTCLDCPADDGATSTSASGSGGGGTCSDPSRGLLQGHVYIFALPPDTASAPSPGATIHLRTMPGETPLDAQAGPDAAYSVELPIGDWLVGGENAEGCINFDDVLVTVSACATTTHDVVLDGCPN